MSRDIKLFLAERKLTSKHIFTWAKWANSITVAEIHKTWSSSAYFQTNICASLLKILNWKIEQIQNILFSLLIGPADSSSWAQWDGCGPAKKSLTFSNFKRLIFCLTDFLEKLDLTSAYFCHFKKHQTLLAQ